MSAIAIDDCLTAEDVHAKARAVIERRKAQEARLKAKNSPRATSVPVPVTNTPLAPQRRYEQPQTPKELVQLVLANEEVIRLTLRELSRSRQEEEPDAVRLPRIIDIQGHVAAAYGVRRFDLVSQRRTSDLVQPRQVSMLLCRLLSGNSSPVIARMHGKRDHTTALHAVKKLDWLKLKLEAEVTLEDPLERWVERVLFHYPKIILHSRNGARP